MAFLQKGSSDMHTGSTMFNSHFIRILEHKVYIGHRVTCLRISPRCRVNASAVPRQFPALPRQFPALPRQFPAVPRQFPAMPRQFPAAPRQFPTLLPHPKLQGPVIFDWLPELTRDLEWWLDWLLHLQVPVCSLRRLFRIFTRSYRIELRHWFNR
jgi:hypothetical protein